MKFYVKSAAAYLAENMPDKYKKFCQEEPSRYEEDWLLKHIEEALEEKDVDDRSVGAIESYKAATDKRFYDYQSYKGDEIQKRVKWTRPSKVYFIEIDTIAQLAEFIKNVGHKLVIDTGRPFDADAPDAMTTSGSSKPTIIIYDNYIE